MASDAGALTTTFRQPAETTEGDSPHELPPARNGLAQRLLEALPVEVRGSLNEEQREALVAAARTQGWSNHSTDIRLSIPFLGRRYYLVLLGGEERRNKARLASERNKYPLRTLTNVLFLTLFSVCCTFVGGFFFTLILIWYLSL